MSVGAPRAVKVAAYRILGRRAFAALQARYWRERARRLRYPFEFREEIEAAVSPGDTVVDVGANVGQYTVLLAGLVGPSGRVLAFEPEPTTHAMLRSVVRGLGLTSVETFQLALGDAAGEARLVRVHDRDGIPNIGLTHVAAAGERSDVSVAVVPLDALCADPYGVDACTFVKIDVEGSELAVLRGGATFLATRRPLVLVELDEDMAARYGSSPDEAIELLGGLGFEPWKPAGRRWRGRSALFRPV